MSGASIETTLEVWASSLRDVKARIRLLFTQERVAASASLFLDGLLGDERRKTGWMRAEAAGDPGPWRQQAILGLGGQDHQLPDRRVCVLCVASRPCLHRPGALSAEGVDGRSRTDDGGACAG